MIAPVDARLLYSTLHVLDKQLDPTGHPGVEQDFHSFAFANIGEDLFELEKLSFFLVSNFLRGLLFLVGRVLLLALFCQLLVVVST